jgi:hypothetical protein
MNTDFQRRCVKQSACRHLCSSILLSVKIVFSCANYLPALPVGVAQICNLLYRRIAFGRASHSANAFGLAAASGLQIRDTAEYNSALLWLRLSRAVSFRG